MISRIKKIMNDKGMTLSEFAKKIDINKSSLSHIFSKRNKPSLEIILKIHKSFPSIDLNWLLLGIKENKKVLNEEKSIENKKVLNEEESIENKKVLNEEESIENKKVLNEEKSIENKKVLNEEKSIENKKVLNEEESIENKKVLNEEESIVIFFNNGTFKKYNQIKN